MTLTFQPRGPFRASVEYYLETDGVKIQMIRQHGDGYRTVFFVGSHDVTQVVPPSEQLPASGMVMEADAARALYEALSKYYGHSPDSPTTAREDLLHERGRVDKLTDTLVTLVSPVKEPKNLTVHITAPASVNAEDLARAIAELDREAGR